MVFLIFSLFCGFLAIFVALYIFLRLRKIKVSSLKMAEIASDIALGVKAYLSRQFKTIFWVAFFLSFLIFLLAGFKTAFAFILGVFASLLTAFLGMNAVVKANVRTADEAIKSPQKAFQTAVSGGAVMSLSITSFSLVILSLLYFFYKEVGPLVGFSFGASLAALFAQIGGGIYTKSADIGADLVGKIEKHIPEDDPRNPAVVADLVGDNVGDCAGRGSDLFQTISSDIVTGMLVGLVFIQQYGLKAIFLPLLLPSLGIISSIAGIFLTRQLKKNQHLENLFSYGLLTNSLIAIFGSYILIKILSFDLTIFFAIFLGILAMLSIAFLVRYYVGINSKSVKNVAEASKRGAALNIITGLSYGLESTIFSVIIVVAAIGFAFFLGKNSLLALIALNLGTDLIIGYIMMSDVFGPITDNASGIAEMSGLKLEVIESLSVLDSVGNTMKATTKAYAMSSGTSSSFIIFATFFTLAGIKSLEITTPFSLIFLFLGVALAFWLSSLVIGSVAKTALLMVDEVRRQFREIKGLIEGKAKPDYAGCIDISTINALKEMILPGLISVGVPVFVGFFFGVRALGALIIGAVVSAALLGPFFNNVGAIFDNAKKFIEERRIKGTFEHQAAVTADTVGDPLKDTAGPSLLIFMKLIGMTALLIINFIH